MRRFLYIAIPVFVLGFGFGNAFWYLASPLWIDRIVSEASPDKDQSLQIASGLFRDADRSHKGSGSVALLRSSTGEYLLALQDFEVTNGPDLEVILVKASNPQNSAEVKAAGWISLGALKGNIGNQNYLIPEGVDSSEYGSVAIWCKQFGVLFSPAPLVALGQ